VISFSSTGDWRRTEAFLRKMTSTDLLSALGKYGQQGVSALAAATPTDSGLAASSWDYTVEGSQGSASITWTNTDQENGFPVAIMLQYGHGTGTGGYVQGRDYINPAIRPVFDRIADEVWKAVTSA
jgi:hypothetical protein